MRTSNWNKEERRNLRLGFGLIGIGLVVIACAFVYWISIPPQMGPHDESFQTVDALYTAVRERDDKQLLACEVKLKSYADSGKLPEPAWRYLNRVIHKAQDGRWQPAAESLYDFMLVQRRDSYQSPPKKTPSTKGKKKF